jgi:penicillin-binding protein 2
MLTIKNPKREIRLFTLRIIVSVALVILFCLGLVARLWYLQISQNKFFSTLSEQNTVTIIPVEPTRGLIYDRNGVVLAKNIPSFNLELNPSRVKNGVNDTIRRLQAFIPITPKDIELFNHRRKQSSSHVPIPLRMKLTEEEVARFYVNQYFFPGVSVKTRLIRNYPMGELMGHVVGYEGRINAKDMEQIDKDNYSDSEYIGKMGVEKQYEKELHGTVGDQEAETDANGRIERVIAEHRPINGQDVYLTIDIRLQQAASEALGDESGSIIVINPNNGEILAMVSKPTYDPAPFVMGITPEDYQTLLNMPERPLYDRSMRGLFAPGSTVKPFYAIGALHYKAITKDFKIHDTGLFYLPGVSHVFHDWDWKHHGHGIVDVVRGITVSCDVFFYNVAQRLGANRQDNILFAFGFGKPTGIDLPHEISGLVPTPAWKRKVRHEGWYAGDTLNIGIGQGTLMVTPLQLAQAVSIIAMRGIRYQPHVLLKTVQGNQINLQPHFPPERRVVLSDPGIWDTIIGAMQKVISSGEGTAHHFGRDAPYPAAGKTGTAQIVGRANGEDENASTPKLLRNNHLFISFTPVDQPQIAVAVIYEHMIGPDALARKVMDAYYQLQSNNKPSPSPAPGPTLSNSR